MQNHSINQIVMPLIMVAGLATAVLMGRWVASGNLMMPGLIIGGILGCIFFLTLGKAYWYMIPFALASGLPAIPLGGRTIELGELFVAGCTAIFVARVAMKKDELVVFRLSHLPILFSVAWIFAVWTQNPTGFLFFGSEVMGARFYLKILLAFCAFIVLASQKPTDKDFERIIWLVFFGILAKTGYEFLNFFVFGGAQATDTDLSSGAFEDYTWHQILAGPALVGTWFLLSKYKTSEIFSVQRPWGILCFLAAAGLASLSGKRMALALVLLAPFIGAYIHREIGKMWLGALAGGILSLVLILGHGTVFTLPFTAQRALSWIPAEWDPSLEQLGTGDVFREQLREHAKDFISEDPWFGKGYATTVTDVITAYNMQEAVGSGGYNALTIGHAVSKNWHNRWLGYSADFGIPYAVLLGVTYLVAIVIAFKLCRSLPEKSGRYIFAAYSVFFISRGILTSHTSGHTALDAFDSWWLYGLLFALYAAKPKQSPPIAVSRDPSEHSLDRVPATLLQR